MARITKEQRNTIQENERILCTTLSSWRPSDLLYYDRIILPGLHSGYMGGGVTFLSSPKDSMRDKLSSELFLLDVPNFTPEENLERFAEMEASIDARERSERERHSDQVRLEAAFRRLQDGDPRALNDAEKDELVDFAHHQLDRRVRRYTSFFRELGLPVSSRTMTDDPRDFFGTGSSTTLQFLFRELKDIEIGNNNIDDMIAFISDHETQRKKKKMFLWQNLIQTELNNGKIMPEHVPELIGDYLSEYQLHLDRARMKSRMFWASWTLKVPKRIALAITGVGLPEALIGVIEIFQHRLELREDEAKAEGRELSYIVHTKRRLT